VFILQCNISSVAVAFVVWIYIDLCYCWHLWVQVVCRQEEISVVWDSPPHVASKKNMIIMEKVWLSCKLFLVSALVASFISFNLGTLQSFTYLVRHWTWQNRGESKRLSSREFLSSALTVRISAIVQDSLSLHVNQLK